MARSSIDPPPVHEIVRVRDAAQMRDAVVQRADGTQVVIMAAAVADYAPASRAGQKIAKRGDTVTLELTKTPDILAELGTRRLTSKRPQVLVGFAAETEDVVPHATAKLKAKHVDLIVANDVSRADAGFEVDTNEVTIVGPDGAESLPRQSKSKVAAAILDRVEKLLAPGPAKAGHYRDN